MITAITFALLVILSPCFAGGPCKNLKCDSMVVRSILNANGLTDVPVKDVAKINMHPRIYVLNFSERAIHKLPEDIGRLSHLSSLYLDYNKLTQLPTAIGQLKNLESLMLNNNQLSNLPEALFGLKTSFNINNNRFCDVSDSDFERLNGKSFFQNWLETQKCQSEQASPTESEKLTTTETNPNPSTSQPVEEAPDKPE